MIFAKTVFFRTVFDNMRVKTSIGAEGYEESNAIVKFLNVVAYGVKEDGSCIFINEQCWRGIGKLCRCWKNGVVEIQFDYSGIPTSVGGDLNGSINPLVLQNICIKKVIGGSSWYLRS